MNYPKRTDFNEKLGEGANCIFDSDKNHCISVTWTGKKYKIILAWIERDMGILSTYPEYPFVKTKTDRSIVMNNIQTDCNHAEWDYYPEHKICSDCETRVLGDFKDEAYEQQQRIAADIKEKNSKPKTKQKIIMVSKLCNFRLSFYKLKDDGSFELSEAKICLLKDCVNFRKKCADFTKEQCKYPTEKQYEELV